MPSLLKDTPPADLVAAIRVVASGEALLAPGITKRLIEEFARIPEPGRQPTTELSMITDREQDVLALVGRGLTNQEIATRLTLSPATVKTHVSRLLTKLGAPGPGATGDRRVRERPDRGDPVAGRWPDNRPRGVNRRTR